MSDLPDLPKAIKIQLISTYSSLVPILIGMFIPDFMIWGLVIAVAIMIISFIYPYIERIKIIEEMAGKRILNMTVVTQTNEKPRRIQLVVNGFTSLDEETVQNEKEQQISQKKEISEMLEHAKDEGIELPKGSEELLRFVEAPVRSITEEYLKALQARELSKEDGYGYTYMLEIEEEDVFEIDKCVIHTPIKLEHMKGYKGIAFINDYDISAEVVEGTLILMDIIDEVPIFTLDYLVEDSMKKQKDDLICKTESKLSKVKDKIIQTFFGWNLRVNAALRAAEAKMTMYQENFEMLLQQLNRLKLGIRTEREPIPWYVYLGWILFLLAVMAIIAILQPIGGAPGVQ